MEVGLYGKLPSHGDFLRRRVGDAFVRVWDAWLQQSLAASRSALGQRWLDIYLTSPVWRFACDGGVCGPRGYAGILAPSVDRVGRYFPLTLVWEMPQDVHPLFVARAVDHWFEAAERLIVAAFAEEQVDLERFDQQFVSLGRELDCVPWSEAASVDRSEALGLTNGVRAQWQLDLGSPSALMSLLEQLLHSRLRQTHGPLSVLWTEGSSRVEPSCLVLGGLPAPSSYAALLSGHWSEAGWRTLNSTAIATPSSDDTWAGERPMSYGSAGATDVGRVRHTNQDAFIERTEIGVWAVADGMGGHDRGEIASRMICDALAALVPGETLRATVESVVRQLGDINAHLRRAAAHPTAPVRSGSTVAALVTRGARCAVLWAGDSRVYRLRHGELQQLTSDHVEQSDGGRYASHTISRAVGGEATLDVDSAYVSVQPGDRFLLCSDGLNHEIADEAIAQLLHEPDRTRCVKSLIEAALRAGGKDNISVVVVDACEPVAIGESQ